MVRLKYFYDALLWNGSLKRVWIITQKNGYQSYGFRVFKKLVIYFSLVQQENYIYYEMTAQNLYGSERRIMATKAFSFELSKNELKN